MIINKFYRLLFITILILFIHPSAYANCSKSYTLGFFNGVWNTERQAFDGRDGLEDLIGDIYNNEPVNYEAFYNHTGSSVGATKLQDVAETFIQRSNEIDASGELGRRFEYFWEFLGSSEPTFIDKIKGIFPNALSLFDSLYTSVATKLTSIISYFVSNPPTETDYAAHNAQLDTLAAEGQKLMLVAHSQGNLFMNHAYDHILPTVTKDRVAVAHIAPASPTLRGDYVLADIDLVINALRIQGANSVPDINLTLPVSKVDVSGHTFIGTYLDPTRDGRVKVKTMIETEMGKLKCPKVYFTIYIAKRLQYNASPNGNQNSSSFFTGSPYGHIITMNYYPSGSQYYGALISQYNNFNVDYFYIYNNANIINNIYNINLDFVNFDIEIVSISEWNLSFFDYENYWSHGIEFAHKQAECYIVLSKTAK